MPHIEERWKQAVDYEGLYEISDCGRVRRVGAARGAVVGRILNLTPHTQGYLAVKLRSNGGYDDWLVHRLVAAAFIGPAYELQTNHKNGNKRDNRPTNLEYVTPRQNVHHARDVLGLPIGSKPHDFCQHGGHLMSETRFVTSNGKSYCQPCYNSRRAKWAREKRASHA